jgi:hypothetical protein
MSSVTLERGVIHLVSAYDLTCRSAYDLTCRSVFGASRPLSF